MFPAKYDEPDLSEGRAMRAENHILREEEPPYRTDQLNCTDNGDHECKNVRIQKKPQENSQDMALH